MEKPGLQHPSVRRDLEFLPLRHQGQQLILVRDHLGFVPENQAIPAPLFQILHMMDGTQSLRDIQTDLMRRQGGLLVPTEELDRIVAQLDQSWLLDSPRFEQARDELVDTFVRQPVRAAFHSGSAYPDDPRALKRQLDDILRSEDDTAVPEGKRMALVAPHIDLSVGARLYARAYRQLRAPARVIVLGVGHQMTDGLFCLTEKDFETPLGHVPTDRPAVQQLAAAGGDLLCRNDFTHRNEHSVEFQLLWLQHLLPPGSFSLVPVLCGSLTQSPGRPTRTAYREQLAPFLRALSALLREEGTPTLLVAGVDLSHIGPKFGHPSTAAQLEGRAKRHDADLLDALVTGDVDRFWEISVDMDHQFNVCGVSALVCLLEVIGPVTGHLLGYEMWHETATSSAVSFAAALLTASQ